MMQWILFVVISGFFIVVSWKSLRHPRSHGFYRFFAWECILGLFLLNVNFWFRNPFAWHQIIAWLLLFGSLVPLAFGVYALRTRGKAVRQREGDSTLLAFEKTTQLVTDGVYKYIRHPLYCSLLLLAWGVFFKSFSWLGMVLAVAATLFLIATAKADETECIQFFGAPYQEYMKRTKLFIPYLI